MKIGELTREAGTTVKTIRFYEDVGLLPAAPRTESGYRAYETDGVWLYSAGADTERS